MHLAIICRRVDIVSILLEHGAKIIVDIPFLEIVDELNQKTRSYGICSFIKDNADNIIYAETELCSSSILTTLNIAFGVNDPGIVSLILKHNEASFIKDIEDDGTILHYGYTGHDNEWEEYYTYHPYHNFYGPYKRLNRKDSVDQIDDLNVEISYLNHNIVSFLRTKLDKRIGLLKPYISTPCRIAYMIMFNTLQNLQLRNTEEQELLKISTLALITKCINYYQLKLEDVTKAISSLIKDNIINNLKYRIKHCKCFKNDDISSIFLS